MPREFFTMTEHEEAAIRGYYLSGVSDITHINSFFNYKFFEWQIGELIDNLKKELKKRKV